MGRLSLLSKAIAKGLRVAVDGDRLVVRGPRRLEALAHEVLADKPAVLALMQEQPALAELDPFTAKVLFMFDGELLDGDTETESSGGDVFGRRQSGASQCAAARALPVRDVGAGEGLA